MNGRPVVRDGTTAGRARPSSAGRPEVRERGVVPRASEEVR
ncbi:hypothetical protein [Microbispora hainanensis]|nr:hypothetical protein [Microbispora hainanensis]